MFLKDGMLSIVFLFFFNYFHDLTIILTFIFRLLSIHWTCPFSLLKLLIFAIPFCFKMKKQLFNLWINISGQFTNNMNLQQLLYKVWEKSLDFENSCWNVLCNIFICFCSIPFDCVLSLIFKSHIYYIILYIYYIFSLIFV